MSFAWWCFTCFFLVLGSEIELASSQYYRSVGGKLLPYYTITVDQFGHGKFKTIQSAIDSVPSNNRVWVKIQVQAGTYREKVVIPYDKPYIILQGKGEMNTIVDWADHDNTLQSVTFQSSADNIIVKFISFRNSFNKIGNRNLIVPAVAALVSGDRSYFYRVAFFGLQDTLWDDRGNHYYKQCTIQGAADFIFGAGRSLYEDCTISVNADRLGPGLAGFITAQWRTSPNEPNGFVFKNCNIYGSGKVYLGRPWREYARVLFYHTNMSNVIHPDHWDPGHFRRNNHATFAEYNNYGPGSMLSHNARLITRLDLSTINRMASFNFIDRVGWLKISLRIGS